MDGSSPAPQEPAPPSSGTRWTPPTPERLQEQIPLYKVLEILGQGGMGAAYKGWQISLERYVAIKILPPDTSSAEANFLERFKQEAKTMAKFTHPGIVAVHDAGETASGFLYIVMEFVEGTDVAQMLKRKGKLDAIMALAITAHVCDALQYAHSHGVVHRDIKPANIMVNQEGVVKVADFGLAKTSNSAQMNLTRTDLSMGTPDFVAPEALMLGVTSDHRVDLYAVGVMLHNMLTGEVPRGMFRMPSQKAGTDPRFDDIIRRAMEEDRELRYQNATEIRRDLDVILTTPLEKAAPEEETPPLQEEEMGGSYPVISDTDAAQARMPGKSRRMPIAAGVGFLAAVAIAIFFVSKKPVNSDAAHDSSAVEKAQAEYPKPIKWYSAMPHLQKIYGDGKGLITEGDWLHADRNLICGTGKQYIKDCILRVVFSGQVSLVLRRTIAKGEFHYIAVVSSSDVHIALVKPSEDNIIFATMTLPEPLVKGVEHEAVFAAQGGLLTLWLDGKRLISAWNSTLPSGSMGVALNKDDGQIKQVEIGELLPKSP